MGAPTFLASEVLARGVSAGTHGWVAGVWPDRPVTVREAVALGGTLPDLIEIVSRATWRSREIERRYRLWQADCAAHTMRRVDGEDRAQLRRFVLCSRAFARGDTSAGVWAIGRWDLEEAWDIVRAPIGREASWQLARLVGRFGAGAEPEDVPIPPPVLRVVSPLWVSPDLPVAPVRSDWPELVVSSITTALAVCTVLVAGIAGVML